MLYYNEINRAVRERLGGRNCAPLYLYSANLEEMVQFAGKGEWSSFAKVYTDPIVALSQRVDAVAVCAILAHKVARQLSEALAPSGVPLLHIADFLAAHMRSNHPHVARLGVLGPKVTMVETEPDFFIGRLQQGSAEGKGFEVLVPGSEEDIEEVNRGMLDEVARGASEVRDVTKDMFFRQARALVDRGAEALVLSSTDLGFVFCQEGLGVPVIEPAAIHAEGIAKYILDS